MSQYFKGDVQELKFYNSGDPVLSGFTMQKNDFWADAYNCYILGEMIWDSARSPLANAIPRAIFRKSFSTIFDSFLLAGSFESYLVVFQKVFGPSVDVTFTVPAPGKLNIDIIADTIEITDFISRYIAGNNYVFDEIIDDEADNIAFQSVQGLESEYELEQMLFEMVPNGIYTSITLTIGGA